MSTMSMAWTSVTRTRLQSWHTSLCVPLVTLSTGAGMLYSLFVSRSQLILPHQVHFGGGILGLCESPNHEVFSTASKSLFERQDGRFIFELPSRITPADAASMAQTEFTHVSSSAPCLRWYVPQKRPLRGCTNVTMNVRVGLMGATCCTACVCATATGSYDPFVCATRAYRIADPCRCSTVPYTQQSRRGPAVAHCPRQTPGARMRS